jgi:hypothetical protein
MARFAGPYHEAPCFQEIAMTAFEQILKIAGRVPPSLHHQILYAAVVDEENGLSDDYRIAISAEVSRLARIDRRPVGDPATTLQGKVIDAIVSGNGLQDAAAELEAADSLDFSPPHMEGAIALLDDEIAGRVRIRAGLAAKIKAPA